MASPSGDMACTEGSQLAAEATALKRFDRDVMVQNFHLTVSKMTTIIIIKNNLLKFTIPTPEAIVCADDNNKKKK